MRRGINRLCLKMPAISGMRRMPDGGEMFALDLFTMVKSACKGWLTKVKE